MQCKWKKICGLMLMMLILSVTVSCQKAVIRSEPPVTGSDSRLLTAEEAARQAELDRQKAIEESSLREKYRSLEDAKQSEAEKAQKEQFVNEDIFFEYDRYSLLSEAQEILKRKVKWMKDHPGTSVIIEGHCDQRGTNEYNIALGEQRAESVKEFMVNLGIEGPRLTTISFGEERPVDRGNNEAAWAKNRRAHFVFN